MSVRKALTIWIALVLLLACVSRGTQPQVPPPRATGATAVEPFLDLDHFENSRRAVLWNSFFVSSGPLWQLTQFAFPTKSRKPATSSADRVRSRASTARYC